MIRHWLSIAAVSALGATAAPALAQNAVQPLPQAGRVASQAVYTAQQAMPVVQQYPGASFAQPIVQPGAQPLPPGAAYPAGAVSGYGYQYGYQGAPGAAPCGCTCCGGYSVSWVQVPVQTTYHYSAPIRRDHPIVEEHVVYDRVVENHTVPVRSTKYVRTKYVKTAPTKMVKEAKGKVVKSAK